MKKSAQIFWETSQTNVSYMKIMLHGYTFLIVKPEQDIKQSTESVNAMENYFRHTERYDFFAIRFGEWKQISRTAHSVILDSIKGTSRNCSALEVSYQLLHQVTMPEQYHGSTKVASELHFA